MSVNNTDSGTGWDFLDQFNTGGKYHKIWETVEDVGRGVRDTQLKNLENPTPGEEQKAKQTAYKEAQNKPQVEHESNSKSNSTYWVIGIGAILLLTGGI